MNTLWYLLSKRQSAHSRFGGHSWDAPLPPPPPTQTWAASAALQGVVLSRREDSPLAVLPPHSSPRISRKLMDVYFEAQQGFGSKSPSKPLYGTGGRGLVVGDWLRFIWRSSWRTRTKGDRVFAVRAPHVWKSVAELRLARSVATSGTLIQTWTYREDVIFTWTFFHWHRRLRGRWEQKLWWAWSAQLAKSLEITERAVNRSWTDCKWLLFGSC